MDNKVDLAKVGQEWARADLAKVDLEWAKVDLEWDRVDLEWDRVDPVLAKAAEVAPVRVDQAAVGMGPVQVEVMVRVEVDPVRVDQVAVGMGPGKVEVTGKAEVTVQAEVMAEETTAKVEVTMETQGEGDPLALPWVPQEGGAWALLNRVRLAGLPMHSAL